MICNDSEKIPTQTIDLDPMMELRVENSVEIQRDCVEPGEDRNDNIMDENTQETVEADSLTQNDFEDDIAELDNL